jgi:hypothetical protein
MPVMRNPERAKKQVRTYPVELGECIDDGVRPVERRESGAVISHDRQDGQLAQSVQFRDGLAVAIIVRIYPWS